jgi:hypothetical protein
VALIRLLCGIHTTQIPAKSAENSENEGFLPVSGRFSLLSARPALAARAAGVSFPETLV